MEATFLVGRASLMGFYSGPLTLPRQAGSLPIEWEEAACLLCGANHHAPLIEAPDSGGSGLWFGVVQCQECGLCFTNPRPSQATIGPFYPSDYRPHRLRKRRPPESGPGSRTWWMRKDRE